MKKKQSYVFDKNMPIYTGNNNKQYYINSIIKGDSIEVMKTFPDKCIDVVFADPPYFMQSTEDEKGRRKELMRADGTGAYAGCDDEWDKYSGYEEYDRFCIEWLHECRRLLKDDGTIWVIGSFQNIYRIGNIMQDMGFWFINDIVWNKKNPTPNMSGTRFCNAHETLLWCAKSKNSHFCFNYKTMKFLNEGKQDRSVWNIGICQGNERLKDDSGNKIHSTQKPEELLKKVILSSTRPASADENFIVLDPFFGTGTTGAVCRKYNRNWIGIEKDEGGTYIEAAEKRLVGIKDESDDVSNLALEVKPPKIPVRQLIEMGMLKEKETMYDGKGNMCGMLDGCGKVSYNGNMHSIHELSARLLGKSNNNGWTFFHVKRDNELVSINTIRDDAWKILKETENIGM